MERDRATAEEIAAFALRVGEADFADGALDRLKRSVLDAVGCAIGALDSEPVRRIRAVVDEFGGAGACALIGGGSAAPDRAALVNGCLVRYLDFMDNYAAKGEVCHPSDNFAAMLAAAQSAGRSGRELLVGLGVAYQVQSRLLETLPTMRAGLNYTTPLAFSVAAGAARLLGLDQAQVANALALAGVSAVSLAVIQAEPVSQWKGLASGETAGRALHNTFLAGRGITGPMGVFDGPFGLDHLVRDHSRVDWSKEALDAPLRVSIKRYNAEFQSHSAVDAAVELHGRGLEADRINRPDVQALPHKITVRPSFLYTRRIPEEMPCNLTVALTDGTELEATRTDYDGFFARPMRWADVTAKFDRLAEPFASAELRAEIVSTIQHLEDAQAADLAGLLARAGKATSTA